MSLKGPQPAWHEMSQFFLLICKVNYLLSAFHFTLENKQFPILIMELNSLFGL